MRRKSLICMGLAMIMLIMSTGCNKQTVDDATAIDESRAEVIISGSKNMTEATTTYTEPHSEKVWVSGKKTTINEVGLNETILYGGYEFTLLDVRKSGNDLMLLDELTGSDTFRKFIVTQRNYGDKPDSYSFDESGKYNKKDVVNVYIKARIKYVQEAGWGNASSACMTPILFNKQGEGTYNYIMSAEGIGFDKYKNIKDLSKPHKDANFYEFELGEEIETYIVIQLRKDVDFDNLYMYSGFLNTSFGDGINNVGDGSYMIKLECK